MASALSLYPPSKAAKTQDRLLEMEADSGAWRSSFGADKCGFSPDFVLCHFGQLTSLLDASVFSSVKWHRNSTYWHIETR